MSVVDDGNESDALLGRTDRHGESNTMPSGDNGDLSSNVWKRIYSFTSYIIQNMRLFYAHGCILWSIRTAEVKSLWTRMILMQWLLPFLVVVLLVHFCKDVEYPLV